MSLSSAPGQCLRGGLGLDSKVRLLTFQKWFLSQVRGRILPGGQDAGAMAQTMVFGAALCPSGPLSERFTITWRKKRGDCSRITPKLPKFPGIAPSS